MLHKLFSHIKLSVYLEDPTLINSHWIKIFQWAAFLEKPFENLEET